MSQAEPKVIVVVNALASSLFEELYNPEFDERHGYHRTQIGERVITTFFRPRFRDRGRWIIILISDCGGI
jgi:hypothetical protein